jgi:predicted Zn-ribbon and HTH transcriptional regulator
MSGSSEAVVLPVFKCNLCGHEWYPRLPEKPLRCASCKSPYWDRPSIPAKKGKR